MPNDLAHYAYIECTHKFNDELAVFLMFLVFYSFLEHKRV